MHLPRWHHCHLTILLLLCTIPTWGQERTITVRASSAPGAWCDGVAGSVVSAGVWHWTVTSVNDHTVTFVPPSGPGPGERQILTLAGVPVPLRWCPPGTFTMGSPVNEVGGDSDEVQHPVTLTQGFWIGETEVTQALWKAVMNGANPSYFRGDQLPVETVSWNDCQAFLTAVNAAHHGLGARLPTEAEWEYAYRAGTTTALHNGTNLTSDYQDANLDPIAWYYCHSGNTTHAVGGKTPNHWGLHDMAGNVWEWCADWYGTYPTNAVTDPPGPASGSIRGFRGGSWGYGAWSCRAACRNGDGPGDRDGYLGFRFVVPGPGLAGQVLSGDG